MNNYIHKNVKMIYTILHIGKKMQHRLHFEIVDVKTFIPNHRRHIHRAIMKVSKGFWEACGIDRMMILVSNSRQC